jgi:hypothetical protein
MSDKKVNCKHGLMEGTCAYCTGLITKATKEDGDSLGSHYGLRIADYHYNSRVVRAAFRSANFGREVFES